MCTAVGDCASRSRSNRILPHNCAIFENANCLIGSLWKPLTIVKDYPLALLDARKVKLSEAVPVDRLSHVYDNEVYYLKFDPDHQWYWIRNQAPDEVTFFKSYDSRPEAGVACELIFFKLQ